MQKKKLEVLHLKGKKAFYPARDISEESVSKVSDDIRKAFSHIPNPMIFS